MKRAITVALSFVLVLLRIHLAEAQQPTKIPRIGFLVGNPLSAISQRIDAFRHGLREFGYVEGKTIVIEWRSADGNFAREEALAGELVSRKVDLIVAVGVGETRASKQATTTIPIIMVTVGDAVGNGFVTTLARPGGNITGLSNLRPELSGKRLELLKDILPKLSRVAIFASSTGSDATETLEKISLAAGVLGLKLQVLDIKTPKDFAAAFRNATKADAEAALFRVPAPLLSPRRKEIAELAAKTQLPVMYETAEEVEAGGLMSYGASILDLFRRAASYVDKILKGAKPSDLPVEQPTKFELVINLKTAKQIGLAIPPNVLARADRVIR